jgi:hypothetical protein
MIGIDYVRRLYLGKLFQGSGDFCQALFLPIFRLLFCILQHKGAPYAVSLCPGLGTLSPLPRFVSPKWTAHIF